MCKQSKKAKKLRRHETWKSFSVTNLQLLMYPYVFVSFLVGFFPYKIVSSKYLFSGTSFVWSTFVAIVYACCSVLSIHQTNFTQVNRPLARVIHANIIIILGLIIIPAGYVTSRSKLRAFQRVSVVARTLSPRDFRKIAPRNFIKDAIKFMPLCSYIPFLFTRDVVFDCTCWFTFFADLVLIMLYVNITYVLEACLEKINESLMKLRKTLITDEPHLLRRVYHKKKNPMLIRELKLLRKQHLDITGCVKLVNDSFGFEMICTITLMMLDITFNIYNCIVFLLSNDYTVKDWFFCAVFMVYYFVILLSIISVCERVKDEAQKIGSNIHQILITTFDEQLTAELELFSVQILQQDTSFSAMGVTIDAGLMTKVVSTISTYLLLLIQFLLVKPC